MRILHFGLFSFFSVFFFIFILIYFDTLAISNMNVCLCVFVAIKQAKKNETKNARIIFKKKCSTATTTTTTEKDQQKEKPTKQNDF